MKMVSLPRARQRLHIMPTSTGYEVRTDPSYNWDGRRRGQTPFTVLQYTISGAGNLRYGNRSYRIASWRGHARGRPACPSILGGKRRALGVLLDIHAWRRGAAHPPRSLGGGRPGLQGEGRDNRTPWRLRAIGLVTGQEASPARASAIAYEASMALYDDVFDPHPKRSAEQNSELQAGDRPHRCASPSAIAGR